MLLLLAPMLGFEVRWPQPDDVMSVAVLRWLQTTLIAPVMEELLYRGFLYRGLAQSRLGPNGAIALTAVLFAVTHIQWIGDSMWWFQMLRIGFLGLLFGWLRERTGSVLPGIGIHALINGVQAPIMYRLMATA
jgi:hypothetical protein